MIVEKSNAERIEGNARETYHRERSENEQHLNRAVVVVGKRRAWAWATEAFELKFKKDATPNMSRGRSARQAQSQSILPRDKNVRLDTFLSTGRCVCQHAFDFKSRNVLAAELSASMVKCWGQNNELQ